MRDPIYLDHAATTPLREEALEAMSPFLSQNYGNASSVYQMAQSARSAVEDGRRVLAACLGARPSEIVFTSGGSEGNNAAIQGVALARRSVGRHLVVSAIEHHSVLESARNMAEWFGFEVSEVPVGSDGIIKVADVESALRPETSLLSIMWANNEIGTIQPIAEIGALARSRGITFHTDAVQAAGLLPLDLRTVPVDLLTISAHKFYGPKGVGALFVREGSPWFPFISGGAQERSRRAGTENVAGIMAMARALELAVAEMTETVARLRYLRDYLEEDISHRIPDVTLNGDVTRRLPNNANVSFAGAQGEALLVALDLDGIMASSGSACSSGSLEPSHVLEALGLSAGVARASLRFTVGRENTRAQMKRTVDVLAVAVGRARSAHRLPAEV